jgi:hypothetical protein
LKKLKSLIGNDELLIIVNSVIILGHDEARLNEIIQRESQRAYAKIVKPTLPFRILEFKESMKRMNSAEVTPEDWYGAAFRR